jgi:AAA ATPase containing von Willebrand factor type A (vWA) domain
MAKKVVTKETAISEKLQKRLSAIKISAKSESEAREKLLKILEENDIDGMEEESTETLIDIAESFRGQESDEPEEDEESEDEGSDEEEVEETEEESEEEQEDEQDDEPEEEPEEVKPSKKASKKAKKEEAKPSKKEDVKPSKKDKKEEKLKRGEKLDPQKNEKDRKYFDPLKKVFGKEFTFSWISKNGVSIKYNGSNGSKNAVKIKSAMIKDGEFICNLFVQTAKGGDILEKIGITDYEINWNGYAFVRGLGMDEVIEIIQQLIDNGMLDGLKSRDKRLGENRKKMEESLEKSSKKVTPEPEEEEEEDEEPEEVKPSKKDSKKAKKAKK